MRDFPLTGVLLDLGGVVYTGNRPLSGALDAISRLRHAGVPLCFVTNTTRTAHRGLLARLAQINIRAAPDELLTPAMMARRVLAERGLTPYLLIHPGLEEDFASLPPGGREAVVIGDAAGRFTYEALNAAYRKLEHGAEFLALAANRNFTGDDGELSLDAGPFVRALEYASRRTATVLGKPSPDFFALAVESMGADPAGAVMIGDDAEGDAGGALAAGLRGILVRTGKYRPGHESLLPAPPTHVADDLAAAVDWLLG
jgi:HAD superfamily hydrolase (TIGR01458 family)